MIKRVDELTEPPVVGKVYLVPTVQEQWFERVDSWPVVPPFHEDRELLNFPFDHIHLDRRFLTASQQRYATTHYDTVGLAVARAPINIYATKGRDRPAVEWRRKQCTHRGAVTHYAHREATWFKPLESAYAGCRLKPGLICPHRGAALGSMPVDADGNVVCPMHGLKWNVASGELVPA